MLFFFLLNEQNERLILSLKITICLSILFLTPISPIFFTFFS